jgi:uncharacterized membrane protein
MEQLAGVFFALLSLLLYFVIIPWQIESVRGAHPSPRSFPEVIAALLFVLAICLFISGWCKRSRPNQKIFRMSQEEIRQSIITFLVMTGYTLLLYVLPYIPVTMAALGVLMWIYGQRKWWKLSLAMLILPPSIYMAFTSLLKLRLP